MLDVVTSMSQLTTLCIQDTELDSLSHLWQIFEKCQLIKKISITLSYNNDIMSDSIVKHASKYQIEALSKLTHIEILAFNDVRFFFQEDKWLLILQLLR